MSTKYVIFLSCFILMQSAAWFVVGITKDTPAGVSAVP